MRRILLPLALLIAAGCEQEAQLLPFDTTDFQPVTRTIGSGATTITSPAGVSVTIPEGVAPAGTTVTLNAADTPPPLPAGVERVGESYLLEFSAPVAPELEVELRVSTEGLTQADLVKAIPVLVPLSGGPNLSMAAAQAPGDLPWFGSSIFGWEAPVSFFQFQTVSLIPTFLSSVFSFIRPFDRFDDDLLGGVFGISTVIGPFGTFTACVEGPDNSCGNSSGGGTTASLGDGSWQFSCSSTTAGATTCEDSGLSFEASQELLDRYPDAGAGAEYIDARMTLAGGNAQVTVDYDVAVRAPVGATFTGKRYAGEFTHSGPFTMTPATPEEPGTLTFAGRTYRYELSPSGALTLLVEETLDLANADGSSTAATVRARVPLSAL